MSLRPLPQAIVRQGRIFSIETNEELPCYKGLCLAKLSHKWAVMFTYLTDGQREWETVLWDAPLSQEEIDKFDKIKDTSMKVFDVVVDSPIEHLYSGRFTITVFAHNAAIATQLAVNEANRRRDKSRELDKTREWIKTPNSLVDINYNPTPLTLENVSTITTVRDRVVS